MTIAPRRPAVCPGCGSPDLLQILREQLDDDGAVYVGAYRCAACGVRRIYMAPIQDRRRPRGPNDDDDP